VALEAAVLVEIPTPLALLLALTLVEAVEAVAVIQLITMDFQAVLV
jgi:hypothetical protein